MRKEEQMRKLLTFITLFSFSSAGSLYYGPKLQEHPVILIAIIGLAAIAMLLLFLFLEHQKRLGKHDEVVIDIPLQKSLQSDKPFRRSYEVYVPESESSGTKSEVEVQKQEEKRPEVKKKPIKPQQKITNIDAKLTKYVGDRRVLDVQQGIAKSHTAIFYKELLHEVLASLKDSESFVEKTVTQAEYKSLESFIVKAMYHAEEIAAPKFLKLLKEIHQLFIYKQHHRVSEYISLYNRSCHELKNEIEAYLKSSMLQVA
jgi:hypothetical protein